MASAKLYQLAVVLMAALAMSAGFQAVLAADEDPLQDFCVAITDSTPSINGFPCKAVADTKASDFKSSALAKAGNTENKNKALVTPLTVNQFSGLNTLGLSAARVDFAVGGLNPPHVHPRATELLFLVEGGPLEVGFVSSNGNTLFQQELYAGDVFVFPRGLAHFQKNRGLKPATAFAALNSQNPGVQQLAQALFAATPQTIASDVLQQTLGVGAKVVKQLVSGQQQK
eukprot:TRINITY_DN442_c0_g1_i1.p1 TRINITY_DN442_c0_g1~~TRINITY_DN442_c0_g1_i1.p1  ORF type:complete len:228 (-),score=28.56 TRINITY_DN442_c0_g1_i1:1522-2205(-)